MVPLHLFICILDVEHTKAWWAATRLIHVCADPEIKLLPQHPS